MCFEFEVKDKKKLFPWLVFLFRGYVENLRTPLPMMCLFSFKSSKETYRNDALGNSQLCRGNDAVKCQMCPEHISPKQTVYWFIISCLERRTSSLYFLS